MLTRANSGGSGRAEEDAPKADTRLGASIAVVSVVVVVSIVAVVVAWLLAPFDVTSTSPLGEFNIQQQTHTHTHT